MALCSHSRSLLLLSSLGYSSTNGSPSISLPNKSHEIAESEKTNSSALSSTGTPALLVPLNLNFVVKARANVLGKLVKPKFQRRVNCAVTYDPLKLNVAVSLKNCTVH